MTKKSSENDNQSSDKINLGDRVLPRQGWQDRQALIKAIVKAKNALSIIEIEHEVYRH